MITKLVSAALVAAALAAAPASAQSAPSTGASISYGDLDLGKAAGRATLDRRIRSAAQLVCGVESGRGIEEFSAVRSCRAQAVESARGQVEQLLASRAGGSGVMVAARR